jgi:RNA-directed DNA polymerase
MLVALGNGVKGGKWFSLIDKVCAASTLKAAWQRVEANRGAAGIDRVSIDRFGEQSSKYFEELFHALREGAYSKRSIEPIFQ